MNFIISDFIRNNKTVFIWAAFAGLLYIFRDLFGLLFITFVMCFAAHSACAPLERLLKLPRRLLICMIYLVFLIFIGLFLFYLTPTLLSETRSFTEQLPQALRTINAWAASHAEEHDWLPQIITQIQEYLTPEQLIMRGWVIGRSLLEKSFQYTSWFLLGLTFSFLIMLDLPRMAEGVRALRQSRLKAVYEETAESVAQFARVVGASFMAQVLTSAVDTAIMAVCLLLMGVNGVVLLCTLVFFCGLVPVLGVFLSSVPLFLMAVNSGGIQLGLLLIALVALISLFEAYVLNPRIVSALLRLNPVMTLIILFIGYSLAGLWGMLLGAPVAVYLYRRIMPQDQERGASVEEEGPAPVEGKN